MKTPWQHALSQAVSDLPTLCHLLDIPLEDFLSRHPAEKSFALRVPREFIARMEKNNLNDPLLLQVLPQAIEMISAENYSKDPLQEKNSNPIPGLLHKYFGRVLLTMAGGCAINCRYCFRRHFNYADNLPGKSNWKNALNYIAENKTIEEVILSGGDPLLLQDKAIAEFVLELEKISHLTRLRIHTRLPIVIPSRVTPEWIAWMKHSRFNIAVVLHSNHPNEINQEVINALKYLKTAEVILLNQSVLLKNINNNPDTLIQLSKKLFQAGVLPYYLHLLDKVDGAAHFDVSEQEAHDLMSALKTKLPGFLVPKLAQEIAGMAHKKF